MIQRPRLLLMLPFVLLTPLLASPPAASVWRSRDLRNKQLTMPTRGGIALEALGNFGNHRATAIHREASGQAELHQRVADFFVVQTGEATLVTGGVIPAARQTAKGEFRGPAIEGGQKQKIAPGDIVHIPAGCPHQLLLAPGGQITYFAIKVDMPVGAR